MADKTSAKPLKFEEAMAELEGLVTSLEKGDMPLDDALKAFEKGTDLLKNCQKQLKSAELRVEKVLADDTGAAVGTAPLEEPTD